MPRVELPKSAIDALPLGAGGFADAPAWGIRSIHEITKRDVIDVVSAIEQRGAAANEALKAIKTFFRWCAGRAVLDRSPADGVPPPAKEIARDRVWMTTNSRGSLPPRGLIATGGTRAAPSLRSAAQPFADESLGGVALTASKAAG